jgi:hypothetical protein
VVQSGVCAPVFSKAATVTIGQLPAELSVEVYPNPTSGVVTLRVRTVATGPGTVELLDLTGRAVQRQAVALEAGDNALKLDISGGPSGLYILRVRDAAGRQGTVRLARQYFCQVNLPPGEKFSQLKAVRLG